MPELKAKDEFDTFVGQTFSDESPLSAATLQETPKVWSDTEAATQDSSELSNSEDKRQGKDKTATETEDADWAMITHAEGSDDEEIDWASEAADSQSQMDGPQLRQRLAGKIPSPPSVGGVLTSAKRLVNSSAERLPDRNDMVLAADHLTQRLSAVGQASKETVESTKEYVSDKIDEAARVAGYHLDAWKRG